MKISIIIPVGDETAWTECEKSIRASVAAGSGLAEAEILSCLDLEHRGAYVARNEGLARATGDWIAWVDCDDLVEENWFGEIASAIAAHPDADIVQFDATEERAGRERTVPYRLAGEVAGDDFARELLRNDGMPAWLWTRAFRRNLFDGLAFRGRVKQDYDMFLRLLPRVGKVWSVGKPLYRYIRHGHGLSNYVQAMDYAAAGAGFMEHISRLPPAWHEDARIGLALTMADVAVHSRSCTGASRWVRRFLWNVLLDGRVAMRLKLKCILASLKK